MIVVFVTVFLLCRSATAAESSEEDVASVHLHFLVTRTGASIQLSPTQGKPDFEKGEWWLSCQNLRFEHYSGRPTLILSDVIFESYDTRMVAEEMFIQLDPPQMKFSRDGRLTYKSEDARRRFLQANPAARRDPREEGMKASEWEHWQRLKSRVRKSNP